MPQTIKFGEVNLPEDLLYKMGRLMYEKTNNTIYFTANWDDLTEEEQEDAIKAFTLIIPEVLAAAELSLHPTGMICHW